MSSSTWAERQMLIDVLEFIEAKSGDGNGERQLRA
jgi:hypothetical protein